MYSKSDAPADNSITCPACGEALKLVKASPSVPAEPKAGPSKPSNAASMPMNKLKDVIKAGSVA